MLRRHCYIGADDIAASDRPLQAAIDVVEKLRPNMIWGMAGPPTAHGNGAGCPKLSSVLMAIKPEHIDEMTYNDCFERSVKVNRGANALFIVLKKGIAYSESYGSYVVGGDVLPPAKRPDRMATVPPAVPAPASLALPAERLPAYRLRLLGLYDEESGAPLENVDVIDVATGTKGITSATGTIALGL